MNNRFSISNIKNIDDDVPLEDRITMEEWTNLYNNFNDLVWIGETKYGKEMDKNSKSWHSQICFEWETSEDFPKVLILNPSIWGYLRIRIQRRVKIRQLEKLFEIAKALDSYLLDGKDKEVTEADLDQMKLDLAKKELLKNPVYQNGFNEQARWLAIRNSDIDKIFKEFKIEKFKEYDWEKGFETIDNTEKLLMIPSIHGWSIITGINTPYLFYDNKKQFDLTEKHFDSLVKSLNSLSKKFGNVQYFEYNNQNDKCNGYFKAKNGKLVYGKYDSPKESIEKGKQPKELKKVDTNYAFNVADLWSINPLDLVYLKEVKNKKIFVFDKNIF